MKNDIKWVDLQKKENRILYFKGQWQNLRLAQRLLKYKVKPQPVNSR